MSSEESAGLVPGSEEPARRWIAVLQRIGRPSGHELRNAMNGAAVNLEVVRGRAARADAQDLVPFAETAASQLEETGRLSEALLALVRPFPETADLGALAAPVVTLLDAIARAEQGKVELVRDSAVAVRTSVAPLEARLLLAELLLEAQEAGGTLCCEVDTGSGPTVRVRRAEGLPAPSSSARHLASSLGVVLTHEPAVWTAVFPRQAD